MIYFFTIRVNFSIILTIVLLCKFITYGKDATIVYKEVYAVKIDSYNIDASSQRSYQKIDYQSSKLVTKEGSARTLPASMQTNSLDGAAAQADLSDSAQEFMENALNDNGTNPRKSFQATSSNRADGLAKTAAAFGDPMEARLSLLEQMIAALTGNKDFKLHRIDMSAFTGSRRTFDPSQVFSADVQSGNTSNTLFYAETEEFHMEYEAMSFKAQGVVNTADGQSINVDLQLNMSREFLSYTHTSVKFERLCDPIVINYDGNAASLRGETFEFDLDLDGIADNIHFTREGSGFLALDKNGDGSINDGSELFGPNSGNGFDELRAYDLDGNGWIDENDEVFDKLLVWTKDKDGNDMLFKLKDLNIGAIYLGDTDTEFSLKGAGNETQGVMRSTSIFLKEDGSGAGTISHIDLAL